MSKSLIIVESPAKARTLKKYLGKDFEVKASVGHIRDLPESKLGVDIEKDFEPQYVTIKGKNKIITELKNAAKKATVIYLAPDPDREGEAIAWHIAYCLKSSKKPMHRAMFHELTKNAILAAIKNATSINQDRFEAQQARRILDRLVGYQISPLLWKNVRRGLSAGRVQSVAVRMVCDREREIEAFKPEEYWSVELNLQGDEPPPFIAQLEKIDGKKARIDNGDKAGEIKSALEQADLVVQQVEKKKKQRFPSPPFTTSTLQQDANRKLHFPAQKTMRLAQGLYEGIDLGDEGPTGLITYMRTDSTRVNNEALAEVRAYIQKVSGKDYLPAKPVIYKTSKSAQDAHEAIRPTDVNLTPEKMAQYLDRDQLALYSVIWKRFVASQMSPAVYDQTSVQIKAGRFGLKSVGSIMRFPGFMSLYVESTDENGSEGTGDKTLPDLRADDRLKLLQAEAKQHFTQPPPRYNEATLVKALEENGVGRPSTYAAIISTIQEKEYVQLKQKKFNPTDLGLQVNDLLVKHFPEIMSIDFTASMEANLDRIEEDKLNWLQALQEFYKPFSNALKAAAENIEPVKLLTDVKCRQCGGVMLIKSGRRGEFLACEKYPDCKNTMNFNRDEAGKAVPVEKEEPVDSGELCDKCGLPLVYKNGRFGRFLACSGYPQCKNIRAQGTGVSCPETDCGGEIVEKTSKRGKVFYSCNRYPKCKFALWDKPVVAPCPQCQAAFLLEKHSKKGSFLVCNNKECGYSAPLQDE